MALLTPTPTPRPRPRHFYFAALPPEINSAIMFAGAGSDSMFAVAAEWEDMSYAMGEMARLFAQTVAVLQEPWLGPSATRMAEAAASYQKWLDALRRQIHWTAEQAYRLVEAYRYARRRMVPLEMIANNRARVRALILNNAFGVHTAAIVALEEQYQGFWAWDVRVLEVYAATVLETLSEMPPWQQPPAITNDAVVAPGSVATAYGS